MKTNWIDQVLAGRAALRRLVVGLVKPEILEVERRRYELNASLQAHWPDQKIDVFELIRENWEDPGTESAAQAGNFIVYIDPERDLDWIATVPSAAQPKITLAESVGARRCSHLVPAHVLHFRRLLGQAIVNAINGEIALSEALSRQAERFHEDRTVELSRRWTLGLAHGLVLLMTGIAAAALHPAVGAWAGSHPVWAEAWFALQGGLLGAYLSIVRKAGKGRWDSSAGLPTHLAEVVTKLSVGGAAGVILFATTRSVHAPPSLQQFAPDSYSLFVLGTAGGWAERLVPKIISAYGQNLNTPPQHESESSPH